MKASFLAVAVLATIAITSAVDKECVQRKVRGLPIHWPNPTDCSGFYRCTNKNVKRELSCPAGKEYNPKTGRCVVMGRNVCKLSLRAALDETTNPCATELSGTYVADVASCRSFSICNNNLAYPQSCDAGSYFNVTALACVPDTQVTCWENLCVGQNNGDYLANVNDCYSFYVCSKEVPVGQECPTGSYFNKGTLNCQPGVCPSDVTTPTTTTTPEVTTTCTEGTTVPEADCAKTNCDQSKCLNAADYSVFESLSSKTMYCVCLKQEALCRTCVDGSEFDPTYGFCLVIATTPKPDTTTPCSEDTTTTPCSEDTTTTVATPAQCKCDQAKCKGAQDTSSFPALDTSNGYCVCVNELPEYRECVDNSIYDATLGICVASKPVTCSGGYKEGDFVPNTNNCMLFYICFDGELIESSCGTGNYFDVEHKNCVPDTDGKCPECTNVQTAKLRNKRSVPQPRSADAPCCPGGLTNGQTIPHPTDYCQFLVCCDGVMKEESCQDGYYFNEALNECVKDVNNICVSPTCVEGSLKPHPTNCSMWLKCCHGVWKEQCCGEGYAFNSTLKACEKDVNNLCWPKNSTTCEGGLEQGQVQANPANCSTYYKCVDGQLQQEFCGKYYYFNPKINSCELDTESICWTTLPCTNGAIKDNASNCSYLLCCNEEWKVESCQEGYYFNSKNNQCEPDTANICGNDVTLCKEGEIESISSNCSYLICCNGNWTEVSCQEGYYFNNKNNQCEQDTENICWPSTPICKEGEIQSNSSSNCSYLICTNGNWTEECCDEGYYFNSQSKQCVEDTANICWPCTNGDIKSNESNCSYLLCCSGAWKEEDCKAGYYFNQKTNQCEADTGNICGNGVTLCQDGDIESISSNCSYLICSNGNWTEKSCQQGYYFNNKNNKCEQDTENICWPSTPICKEGEIQSNSSSNCSYLICSNGNWTEECCDEGYYFNSQSKQCMADTANICWPCMNGDIKSNESNCSYLLCCSGAWKEEECKAGYYFNQKTNQCEADIGNICGNDVTLCQEGDIESISSNCSYLICSNGNWTEKSCQQGYYFNNKNNQCEQDTENICWPSTPICEEGEIKSNSSSNCSYLLCCSGVWKEEYCKAGYYFNQKTNQCVVDTFNICGSTTPCNDGDIESNSSNCSYLICCSGVWQEESCKAGYYFNQKTNQCEVDTQNICGSTTPCHNGDIESNSSNCSYLLCCSGIWQEESCKAGYYFNQKINQCEVDTENICGSTTPCNDGDIESNSSNCSYLLCCSGVWQEESCKAGYYFNNQNNQCEPDTTNICGSSSLCTNGDIESNSSNCSYLICCSGVWQEESCKAGYYFNQKTNQCEVDTENICGSTTPCSDGDIESISSNCSYLLCCSGVWQEEYCKAGYYFNQKTNHCEVDTQNICGSTTPCNDGDIESNSSNCSYLLCCSGVWQEESCKAGYYFNNQNNQCEPDTTNICGSSSSCTNGDIESNSSNCSYLLCCSGVWKVESCQAGYYFNKQSNKCELDTANICGTTTPCNDGDIESSSSNCSYLLCCSGVWQEESCKAGYYFNSQSKQCEPDTANVCGGSSSCNNGDVESSSSNCSYLVCCNGVWKEESCKSGYYFNSQKNKCVIDTANICGSGVVCKTGEVMQNPRNCSSYLECCSGAFVEKFCEKGYYFSKISLCCQPDTENVCWPKETCNCTGGHQEGDRVPSDQCDTFYICSSGHLVLQECGLNSYYNATNKTCEPDTEQACWKNYCADQLDGVMVQNPRQCNAFYLCEGGNSTDEVCPIGQWFNPKQASCEPDLNAVCYNPCSCQNKITVMPHPECTKFYWCNGNQTFVGTCAVGGFDATIGACNPQISCSTNECDGKPNYYVYADPDDKTKVYVCMNGVPVLVPCPPGTEFNGNVCAHVSDPDCDPTPCLATSYVPPYATLNATEDNAFCMCRDGYATKQYCSPEYVFSTEYLACFSNAPCDPMVCKYQPDYFAFDNRNDTSSFCLCVDNEAVIVQCPSGSFNPYTATCTNIEISEQCDQLVCQDKENYYTYADKNNSTNGFCRCDGHMGVFVECPENSVFDSTFSVCKLQNINCDSSKCQGVADNTKLPALTTSLGYCECVKGNATYYNCPNSGEFNTATLACVAPVCDSTKCAAAADYTAFPATNTTTGFCLCIDKKVQYHDCDVGGQFNTILGMCMMPLKNCDNSMCVGQPDNTKLPAWSTFNGYCLCSGGIATFEDCLNGWVFDNITQVCAPENLPVEDLCDTIYCDNPANAGQIYPSTTNAYGYCVCDSTGPKFEYCAEGEIFDTLTMSCSPSTASQCDLSLCANASPDNTYSTPAKNSNTSFCFCSDSHNVMLLNCPTGKYYDNAQQLCVSAIAEGCSCPNGLQNGDSAPDTMNCTQYFICNSGSMHQQCCPTGQYFNTDCNNCIEDDGTCMPKEACTCLGAYREGERVIHPHNNQLFYVCENKMLHERNCGSGRIFNKLINQCMKAPLKPRHNLHKRSADVQEFFCINDEKRSVPSNCFQYEICVNQKWKRRNCTQFRYYNPEQQKCLEPRDDTICAYAKVNSLPACSAEREQRLHKGRNCQQYFRCQNGKWRLRNCPKSQYFEETLAACLPHGLGDAFECLPEGGATDVLSLNKTQPQCEHLSVRPYDKNCGMYLMCLENHWWYHYCPLGMYFNHSLNYCVPNTDNVCLEAIKPSSVTNVEDPFVQEQCTSEGVLRPSALACNRYYICIGNRWQQQQCALQDYYDVEQNKCSPDTEGICSQLQKDCLPLEKRAFPLNCSAYEECSNTGKWSRMDCLREESFDDLLQQCVPNDGICSVRGLKRVCNERETRAVALNCTQFYFCEKDTWALGNCLRGHMYAKTKSKCVPHSLDDKCKPLMGKDTQFDLHTDNQSNLCADQVDGTSVAHPTDCTRYFICIEESLSHELQCTVGSFYDSSAGYCRPNDGSCRLNLTGVCANATDESLVAHPTDCQAYYLCSTLTGQQLKICPEGQYYHNFTRQCRIDHGECKGTNNDSGSGSKCQNVTHGTLLTHERYCNIYYACVKGLAIPVECPDNYQFNALLGKCIYDADNQCQDGQLVVGNQTYSCGNLSDGSYIADRKDCTRYYICSKGQAQPKKCAGSTYFDSEQLLCVPDDGSCPYVDDDEPNLHPMPPDPIVCEGKHGYLMPDPLNCNNFYVCINSQLRHERCYALHFFNASANQCQQKLINSDQNVTEVVPEETTLLKGQRQQCEDEITTVEQLCQEYSDGTTIAEQADCRIYITCQEEEDPISQRCRNGESYDSLLGFCRQNDGTCLLENGQRAGECSDRHGQLARDTNNCRQYFICVNGQKIAQTCQEYEYFSKSQNMCINDTLNTCNPEQQPEDKQDFNFIQSCVGLNESKLYPYIHDNCRSYFQCVRGVVKVNQCADDLYFDSNTVKCVRNLTECAMPSPKQTMQRKPVFRKQTYDQLCSDRKLNQTYANIENHCRSFYTCQSKGVVIHELCPLGLAFDPTVSSCVSENKVICKETYTKLEI